MTCCCSSLSAFVVAKQSVAQLRQRRRAVLVPATATSEACSCAWASVGSLGEREALLSAHNVDGLAQLERTR